MFPIDGVMVFQSLIIDSLVARRMWVITVPRCDGINSIERLSKARSGVEGIRHLFQKLFRSEQLHRIWNRDPSLLQHRDRRWGLNVEIFREVRYHCWENFWVRF